MNGDCVCAKRCAALLPYIFVGKLQFSVLNHTFLFLHMHRMLYVSRLSTTTTRNFLRHEIFSQTGQPRLIDLWTRFGHIGVKCFFQVHDDTFPSLETESRADKLAVSNLRSYPLRCIVASRNDSVKCLSQGIAWTQQRVTQNVGIELANTLQSSNLPKHKCKTVDFLNDMKRLPKVIGISDTKLHTNSVLNVHISSGICLCFKDTIKFCLRNGLLLNLKYCEDL